MNRLGHYLGSTVTEMDRNGRAYYAFFLIFIFMEFVRACARVCVCVSIVFAFLKIKRKTYNLYQRL